MRVRLAPTAVIASAYVCSRASSACERAMRATPGILTMVKEMMTFFMFAPKTAISVIASRMFGIAFKPSHRRISTLSSTLLTEAYSPSAVPISADRSPTVKPTVMEICAP